MGKYKAKEGAPPPVKRDGAYVMMLFITLVAIAVGCVLLHLDNEEYGGKQPQKEAAPNVQPLGQLAKTDPVVPAEPAPGGGMPPGPAPVPPPPMMP